MESSPCVRVRSTLTASPSAARHGGDLRIAEWTAPRLIGALDLPRQLHQAIRTCVGQLGRARAPTPWGPRTASGTGQSTTCGATFNQTWANVPICEAQRVNSAIATYISAESTTTFTVTTASAFTTGTAINVICRGYE